MKLFSRNNPAPSIEAQAAAAQARARNALAVFDDIAQEMFDAADQLVDLSSQRAVEADELRAQSITIGEAAAEAVNESVDLYEQSQAFNSRANKIAGLSL